MALSLDGAATGRRHGRGDHAALGVDAIAHTMNIAPDTLEDEVEPFLLRTEFVVRTPRGRVATTKAYQHLQFQPPTAEKEPQSRLFE